MGWGGGVGGKGPERAPNRPQQPRKGPKPAESHKDEHVVGGLTILGVNKKGLAQSSFASAERSQSSEPKAESEKVRR